MSGQKNRRRPPTGRRRPQPNPMQSETVEGVDPRRQAGQRDLLDIANDIAGLTADLQQQIRLREGLEARCGVLRMREEHLTKRIEAVRVELAGACSPI
jgi:hypothetical protein